VSGLVAEIRKVSETSLATTPSVADGINTGIAGGPDRAHSVIAAEGI